MKTPSFLQKNNLAFYGFTPRDYMVVSKNRGKTPKMDGENKGTAY